MRYLVLVVVLVIAAPSSAVAESWSLDYRASDPSCVAGARFADEVSAKLGFVPWNDAAAAKIRVRVVRDGAQFTGSFRNADGQAKIIDGATCEEVTASLVVTVAAAVDRSPGKPMLSGAAAPAAPPSADGAVPVTFTSAEGRRIDISLNNASGVGRASNGTTVVANYFQGLCTSPCTAQLRPGRHYLAFRDPDSNSTGGGGFLIDRGTTITLKHHSRRGLRVGSFVAGAALLGLGILGLSQSSGKDGAGVGAIVLGTTGITLGGTLMMMPLWINDTFAATQVP